jgi:hypothetical protein
MNLPVDAAKAIVGLRPSFSAHVRWGERGAPVFPCRPCYDMRTPGSLKILQIRAAHAAVALKTAASAGMNPAETGSVCR